MKRLTIPTGCGAAAGAAGGPPARKVAQEIRSREYRQEDCRERDDGCLGQMRDGGKRAGGTSQEHAAPAVRTVQQPPENQEQHENEEIEQQLRLRVARFENDVGERDHERQVRGDERRQTSGEDHGEDGEERQRQPDVPALGHHEYSSSLMAGL